MYSEIYFWVGRLSSVMALVVTLGEKSQEWALKSKSCIYFEPIPVELGIYVRHLKLIVGSVHFLKHTENMLVFSGAQTTEP